jgi:hypothetical protein
MDFMAGYDSECDGDVALDTPKIPKSDSLIEIPPTVSPEPKKKKRKINIDFLPQAIQDGLTRRVYSADSDDEDMQPSIIPIQIVKANDKVASNDHFDDPLLKLLSAVPIQDRNNSSKDVFGFAKQPTATLEVSPKLTFASKPVFVTNLSSTKAIAKVATPVVVDRTILPQIVPENLSTTSVDWSQIHMATPSYSQHLFQQQVTEQPNLDTQRTDDSALNKRKKDRAIEMQLQSGDMSTLDQVPIREVQGFNQWDAGSYIDQQQKELQIMNQYTNNGAMKSIAQPTKTQNRRHQLSSLALRAAETEISLLDVKSQRGKSKSQTQNKYGW